MGLFRRIRKRAQTMDIYSVLEKKYIEGVTRQTDEDLALLEAQQDDVDPPPSRLSVEDLLG